MTGIGEKALAQPVKPPLRERCACLAKLVKNRLTLTRRGYAYGGTTPAGNPRKYWTYGFLRWLDGIHPADDGGIRALAALRNEVEAADETREALLAEYRAAVAAGSCH